MCSPYFQHHYSIIRVQLSHTFFLFYTGNENPIDIKASKLVFTASSREEKRLQQRRNNVTDVNKRKNGNENAQNSRNAFEDVVRQTQLPIKKQIKFKRLRFLSSDESSSKMPNNKLKDDTEELNLMFTKSDLTLGSHPPETVKVKTNDNVNKKTTFEVAMFTSAQPHMARRTPLHRKNRRRLTTVPLAEATPLPKSLVERYSERKHIMPSTGFGKKILMRTKGNLEDETKQPASPFHMEIDGKSIEKAEKQAPNGIHFKTNGKLAQERNISLCATNYRMIRPGAANLKREISLNDTLCSSNLTNKSLRERLNQQNLRVSQQVKVKNDFNALETAMSHKIFVARATEEAPVVITPPIVQFTMKSLSSTAITSVSTKIDDEKTKNNENSREKLTSIFHFDLPKAPTDAVIFKAYNLSKAILYAAHATIQPSLVPYLRANLSKIYRNMSRNLHLPKLSYPLLNKTLEDLMTTTTESLNTMTANGAEPNTRYSVNLTSKIETETETPAETITLLLTNSTTNLPNKYGLKANTSSTPIFVTYGRTDKVSENWMYDVKKDLIKNITVLPVSVNPNHPNNDQPLVNVISGHQHKIEEMADDSQMEFHIVIYVLAGLGVVPLIAGIVIATKIILGQNKKQVKYMYIHTR